MTLLPVRISPSLFVPISWICRDGGCQFFQWADEVQQLQQQPAAGGATPRSHFSRPPPPSSSSVRSHGAAADFPGPAPSRGVGAHGNSSSNIGAEGVCRCGEPASVVVTKKAGPNLGRQFYACRKPRYAVCFTVTKWAPNVFSITYNPSP